MVKEGIAKTREEREVRKRRGMERNKRKRRKQGGDPEKVGDGVKAEREEEGSWIEDRGGSSNKWGNVGGEFGKRKKRGKERRVKEI